ncbi:MAG TPA: hypothetical protein VGJ81_03425 [Thermoanaerobaculia bacterium]
MPVTPIYPTNGQQDVSQTFTLKWTNGIDSTKGNIPYVYNAPVYDVYGRGWGGADLLQGSGPCNPDSSGYCTMSIAGAKSNSYMYWHVIAKFPVPGGTSGPYMTTDSSVFNFTTSRIQTAPVSFETNDWIHFLTAYWCGGSSMLPTATSEGSCESFKVINQTYHADGDLYNGDVIALQSNGNYATGYYVTAVNGGGSNLWVAASSIGSTEQFTINKVSDYWTTPEREFLTAIGSRLRRAAGITSTRIMAAAVTSTYVMTTGQGIATQIRHSPRKIKFIFQVH